MKCLSIAAAVVIAATFNACATQPTVNESKEIGYLKNKTIDADIDNALTKRESINVSEQRMLHTIIKSISSKTGKEVVVSGDDLPIEDNIKFLNYQDIADYVFAKELGYKIEIEHYPRFDKISVKALDTSAQKLKKTPISIVGTANIGIVVTHRGVSKTATTTIECGGFETKEY